jgi:hypothetical protein
MFLNPAVSNLSTKEEGERQEGGRGGIGRGTGDKVEYRVEYSDFSFLLEKARMSNFKLIYIRKLFVL